MGITFTLISQSLPENGIVDFGILLINFINATNQFSVGSKKII